MEAYSVLELVNARKGHFLFESGHHGDLWLDLATLCLRPALLKAPVAELAEQLAGLNVDAVCGPLVEGAFVGLMVATELEIPFTYSERFARPAQDGLFPRGYRVPSVLEEVVRGKRVAIVNDVINAGSAVKGTYEDLRRCGATVVAIGALLVLGSAASEFAADRGIDLVSLAALPNNLWTAGECPLCEAGVPLLDIEGFGAAFTGLEGT
jgi:orotate phosphoribosyltransferase